MSYVYLIFLFLLLLIPRSAFAWGPGTHLEIGLEILKDLAILSPFLARLLARHPNEFLYGMISADLPVGKKYAGRLHHSHNWDVAFKILDVSKGSPEKASAYGYLAHLSSDIVAHNYYIPYMMIASYPARLKNHTYWEARFDAHVRPGVWDKMGEIVRSDFSAFDAVLEANLKIPFLSFRTNKRIFNTILAIQRLREVRAAVKIHSRFSLWPISANERSHYMRLAIETTRDFLKRQREAPCTKGDPSGALCLKYARGWRDMFRHLVSSGVIERRDIDGYLKKIRKNLLRHIFREISFEEILSG